jgi:hypothetical protein
VRDEANLIPISRGVQIREGNETMSLISRTSVPDVPAEQRAFDQAHKHLCKLRWIGQDVDSEYVLTVLRAAGLVSRSRAKPHPQSLPAPRAQNLIA